MNSQELIKCLCCGESNLRIILDLGNQSPVNNYSVKEKFPLRLNICMDCSHAQLSHAVDPKILFSDYPYMSGVSTTMKEYYKWFAKYIANLTKRKLSVLDIACNDGSQLDEFKKIGFKTFGVEPDKKLSILAGKKHKVYNYFWPKAIPFRKYNVIIAQNILAHVPNPIQFLIGCMMVMDKDSILCIQTSQANMIQNYQFDTIYHEHLSFFNRRSIGKLFNRCSLQVIDYKFLKDIHGGSELYIVKKMPEITLNDYSDFSNRCYKFSKQFRQKVQELQKDNIVICYGAAAKMINLIRFTGIKPAFIIDDTPTKKDKIVDGIPITEMLNKFPHKNYVMIPVWNFYDEIRAKVNKLHPNKFKFMKYIPKIVIE